MCARRETPSKPGNADTAHAGEKSAQIHGCHFAGSGWIRCNYELYGAGFLEESVRSARQFSDTQLFGPHTVHRRDGAAELMIRPLPYTCAFHGFPIGDLFHDHDALHITATVMARGAEAVVGKIETLPAL